MTMEPEIKAMTDVYQVLKNLEDKAKQRVIEWVVGKFSLSYKSQKLHKGPSSPSISEHDLTSFASVADMFANANVKTDADKILVVASFLQEKNEGGVLTGRDINKELNHLGHGVSNITARITSLINKKPKLMIQTRKEGKSKQAQKKYKVTTEGFAEAKKMISSGGSETE